MAIFVRLCTTAGVLLATAWASAVTPIQKVTTLLEDLQADVEAQGKEESATYDKFACFCKDKTKDKSEAIEKSQDELDQNTAKLEELEATEKELTEDIMKEKKILEATKLDLKNITEVRDREHAEYEITHADLTKAVTSAKKAHKALSEAKPSFLELGATQSDVRQCLELADALGMVKSSHKAALASFLQVDPEDPAYKFHSDKILEIIKDLQTDFETERDNVQKTEDEAQTAFEAEEKTLKEKIKTSEETIETKEEELETTKTDIAKTKIEIDEIKATLADDSTYLHDLTVRCQDKGKIWDQRTQMRFNELEAIKKAIEILKKDAADADETNKRALLLAKVQKHEPAAAKAEKKVQVAAPAPVKAAEKAPAKAGKKPAAAAKPSAKKSPSFLQVELKSSDEKDKEQTIAFLRHESARLESTMLSSLAAQLAKDPFVKVKKLIQGLLERLLTEAKQEATKQGFCDTELGKSYEDRENRYAEINKLDADLEDLGAQKDKLELEIETLTEDLKKLNEDLEKAEADRKEEKEDNQALIKKAGEGAKAVAEAIVILKDFYKDAAKAKMFVQVAASPIEEDDPGYDKGAYRGQQSGSNEIIGLLEVLKSDYERTVQQTADEEAEAHRKWIEFERTSKTDISAKETKKELDEQDLDKTKSAYDAGMKDLQTATDLLDAALQNIEDLKPTCIDTGMSYAERVEKREAEIAALKKACKALEAEAGPHDCPA